MHRFMKKVIATGIAAMCFATAAVPAHAMDPILPFRDVKGGMTGTAYTVVDSSGEIRSFDVDIVGNMDNGKGSSRMIMARARGPVIEQTGGILQGMSGSPVYVNGRLVGAVAAGIKEMTPYTFFITPIEDMMKLWTMPDTKNKTRLKTVNMHKVVEERKKQAAKEKEEENKKAETSGNAILNRIIDVIHEAEDTARETKAKQEADEKEQAEKEKAEAAAAKAADKAAAKDAAKAKEAADAPAEDAATAEDKAAVDEAAKASTPVKDAAAAKTAAATEDKAQAKDEKALTKQPKAVMYLSGFSQPGIDFLQKNVPVGRDVTFMPMGVRTEGEGNTLYNASLKPGSAVGVAIVYGDFAVGATGTVTAVDGKKILGFGHPFLHRGNVNYFMTDATVVGTISGQSNGMKIANIGNIIGRISQDRETGIAGTIGDFPTVVPVKVRIKDTTLGRTDDYGARIAYDEDFLPELSGGIAYAAMTKTSDTLAGSTANVHFTIRTNAAEGGKFERSNMFYNTADVGQIAVGELMQAMSIVCSNTEQESDIVDVQVDVQMENGRKTATLVSAVPDKATVKPGDLVKFTTTIKPYRRDKETLLIPYRVPVTAPEGPLTLDIRGGGVAPIAQLKLLQQTGLDLIAQEDKTATTKDKLQGLKRTGRNNEIIIAPGAQAQVMMPAQQRKAAREAAKAAREAAQQRKFSFSLNKPKNENAGETKFTTNYIIDNVIHSTLQVERK
ncbi:SpoIVB peptidase S55 domain-containing protein [Mitsuokella jalaludinii]|uniref:SpoIVB peptidase S55 domain-containing protein n=4 Tax=Mitsuokella TaxID=52225 RepID=UPI001D02A46C|nr:SpoIVB peptidase S55 domain-containing protein [Mitsuokella jalaludinii]MCB5725468.1 SpoIVB peptidase S55 domain protein [Mitsuokella jalaludinii]